MRDPAALCTLDTVTARARSQRDCSNQLRYGSHSKRFHRTTPTALVFG